MEGKAMLDKELMELREILDENVNFEELFEAFETFDADEFENFKRLPMREKRAVINKRIELTRAKRAGKPVRKLAIPQLPSTHVTTKEAMLETQLPSTHVTTKEAKLEKGKSALFDIVIEVSTPATKVNPTLDQIYVPLFGYASMLGGFAKNPEILQQNPRTNSTLNYKLYPHDDNLNIKTSYLSLAYVETLDINTYNMDIKVSCSQVPYKQLIYLLASHDFVIKKMRYQYPIQDTKGDSKTITFSEISLFGKTSSDSLNISTFKRPDQMQANIIDIDMEIYMNAFKTMFFPVELVKLQPNETWKYTFNMFIEKL